MIKLEFKSHNQNLIRERRVPLITNHLYVVFGFPAVVIETSAHKQELSVLKKM